MHPSRLPRKWIIIQGEEIYAKDEDVSKDARKKWQTWQKGFDAVASTRGSKFVKETQELAGSASVAMWAIEKAYGPVTRRTYSSVGIDRKSICYSDPSLPSQFQVTTCR